MISPSLLRIPPSGTSSLLAFELLRQLEEQRLVPSSYKESYPKWHVVRTETGRNGKPAEVQEIHEISVSTEIRVELNGVGQHLLDRVDRPG